MGFVLAAQLGCGASRQTAYLQDSADAKTPEGASDETALQSLHDQAEAAWQAREDTAKLREAIALYEQVLTKKSDDRELLTRLARAYYFLGNGHLTEKDEVLAAFDRGARYGEQAMALNTEFKKAVAGGADDDEALKHLTKDDVGGLYWAYSNLGKWSVLMGFTTVLKYKNKLKRFIDRVTELDPSFFYGAADRGQGAFYAKAPDFAGGDLDKAKTHFTRSLNIAPDYLGTKVLIAEYWATKKQDKDMYQKLLKEVLEADPASLPDIVPEQKAEQKNAQKLLDEMDDRFE
ncbi:MAG: TRAP transporter TatT component family protein [Pseudomonadota bacterium]